VTEIIIIYITFTLRC